MKRILMIGTGGTIASEMTPDGLSPELTPAHYLRIAGALCEHYGHYDGFVISHGTDTMAYTAAALSYLVRGAKKPIILTGAQKPINFDSTDSKINLSDAFICACSEKIHGVNIVFSGRVITGTRARKTCSKSYAAFSSINYPDIGTLQDGRLLCYIESEYAPTPLFSAALDANVGLIKMIPGTDVELMDFLLARKDAVVMECFGVGGLPSYSDDKLFEVIRRRTEAGKYVVVTTQVQNEGSDLSVYEVGHRLKSNRRVLEAYDMTSEAALAKIMWILAETRDPDAVTARFYTPVGPDMLYRG